MFKQLSSPDTNLPSTKIDEFIEAIRENTRVTRQLNDTNERILNELKDFRKSTERRLKELENRVPASSAVISSPAIPVAPTPVSEKDILNIKERLPLKNHAEIKEFEDFLRMSLTHTAAFKSFMDTIQPGEDQHSRFRALLTAVFNRNTIFQEYSWHGQSSLRQKTNHSLKQTLPAQYIVDYIRSLRNLQSEADNEIFRTNKNNWGKRWIETSRDMFQRAEREKSAREKKKVKIDSTAQSENIKKDTSETSDQGVISSSFLQIYIKSEY